MEMSEIQENSIIVSVIIPTYNVSDYIKNLLIHLKKQQVETVEFIFIDDGSTDETPMLLDKLCDKDYCVVIHQENKGVAAARNTGVAAARGKYICFVDPDDSISDNYFACLIDTALSTSADVVVTDWAKVRDKEITYNKITSSQDPVKLTRYTVFREILDGDSLLCSLWGKLFARHLFVNNSFPKQRTCSDFVPCFTALAKANAIWYVSGIYYFYTSDRESSLQNSQTARDIQISVMVHQFLSDYIRANMPELTHKADLDLAYAKVQACIHICKSAMIPIKPELFNYYRSGTQRFIFSVWCSHGNISSKVLYTLVTMGYKITSASLRLRSTLR
jgi:glycosyltransferase involved in cell wall biosynthesis